jgi:hypothetical protein
LLLLASCQRMVMVLLGPWIILQMNVKLWQRSKIINFTLSINSRYSFLLYRTSQYNLFLAIAIDVSDYKVEQLNMRINDCCGKVIWDDIVEWGCWLVRLYDCSGIIELT